MAAFVYINGYPGVGKFTVAKELEKLLPNAEVIGMPLAIKEADRDYERTDHRHGTLRQAMYMLLLACIAVESSRKTWIFTDSQPSCQSGSFMARQCSSAAAFAGVPFISVILTCATEENLKRAISPERRSGRTTTKLTDVEILQDLRKNAIIHRFGNRTEMELDVTNLSAAEASHKVFEHICKMHNAEKID